MKLSIDLNADLGEGAATEAELLGMVSSANIACGFHAGTPSSMTSSIKAAHNAGVAVGAHPSLADRENFGRRELPVSSEDVFALVTYQLGAFQAVASSLAVRPNHVKPHGALYNMAARDAALADAVAHALAAVDRTLILFAPAGSKLAQAAEALGLRVAREVFADRNYQPDGALVPRGHPAALLSDPDQAARRILRMLRENVVRTIDGRDWAIQADTVCVHGDTPDAVAFARKLRAYLANAGITVGAPLA
jgi:5-oxoprolinase (ATP-hydrolysing) subunit A